MSNYCGSKPSGEKTQDTLPFGWGFLAAGSLIIFVAAFLYSFLGRTMGLYQITESIYIACCMVQVVTSVILGRFYWLVGKKLVAVTYYSYTVIGTFYLLAVFFPALRP